MNILQHNDMQPTPPHTDEPHRTMVYDIRQRPFKKIFLRSFFALEACVFLLVYLFGAQGIQAIIALKKSLARLDGEIQQLEADVSLLDHEVAEWQGNDFYKERIARERLHMARKNETIFFLDSQS